MLRVQSHKAAFHFTHQPQIGSSLVTRTFCLIWLQIGSHNPLLGFNNFLEQLIELRETHLLVYYIINNTIKDIGEWPDEDMHKAISGMVLSAGSSVTIELWCATLPAHRCIYQLRNALNLILWGFLSQLHH